MQTRLTTAHDQPPTPPPPWQSHLPCLGAVLFQSRTCCTGLTAINCSVACSRSGTRCHTMPRITDYCPTTSRQSRPAQAGFALAACLPCLPCLPCLLQAPDREAVWCSAPQCTHQPVTSDCEALPLSRVHRGGAPIVVVPVTGPLRTMCQCWRAIFAPSIYLMYAPQEAPMLRLIGVPSSPSRRKIRHSTNRFVCCSAFMLIRSRWAPSGLFDHCIPATSGPSNLSTACHPLLPLTILLLRSRHRVFVKRFPLILSGLTSTPVGQVRPP